MTIAIDDVRERPPRGLYAVKVGFSLLALPPPLSPSILYYSIDGGRRVLAIDQAPPPAFKCFCFRLLPLPSQLQI